MLKRPFPETSKSSSLGLVGLAQALPTMLLALPSGFLADKFSRPLLVRISLLAMTLTSLGLAWLSYTGGSTAWMYTLLFLDAAAVMIDRGGLMLRMTGWGTQVWAAEVHGSPAAQWE